VTLCREPQTQPKGATRLSWWWSSSRPNWRRLRLACESLLVLSIMTQVASCIVADPPQYTDPVQTRPELAVYSAKPSVYQVVVVQTPSASSPSFTVPVRSEDAGEQLLVNFWRDYGTSSKKFIDSKFIAASTYDDTSDRAISYTWTTVSLDDSGCHTFSMVVAHLDSYQTPQVLDTKKADTDAALITWWVNVNPDPNALTTLSGCPSRQAAGP